MLPLTTGAFAEVAASRSDSVSIRSLYIDGCSYNALWEHLGDFGGDSFAWDGTV